MCNRYCNSQLLLAYSLTDKYGRVFSLFQMFILNTFLHFRQKEVTEKGI